MLLEFTVKNFLSFKDEVTLSLYALKEVTGKEQYNLISVGGQPILKTAVIYGANASGKTNLIKAMNFMKSLVTSSVELNPQQEFDLDPFQLHTGTRNAPCEFEIVFVHQAIYYRYGVVIDQQRVQKEWLYYAPGAKEIKLFERKLHNNTYTFKLGKPFTEGQLIVDHQLVRENALFLAVVAKFNGTISRQILDWFTHHFQILFADFQQFQHLTIKLLKVPTNKEPLVNFMKATDTGIDDLILVTVADSEMVIAKHSVFNGAEQPIESLTWPLSHESEGTQKLFALSGPLLDTLRGGKTLVVDELDIHLHPMIMRFLLNLFHSPEENPQGAQLIFVIHDTHLLTSRFFRRDQIWFTQKDLYGATLLSSLAHYEWDENVSLTPPGKDAYQRIYFQGGYGAVPLTENWKGLQLGEHRG
jgi:AAA15 family ATPase/GTPase